MRHVHVHTCARRAYARCTYVLTHMPTHTRMHMNKIVIWMIFPNAPPATQSHRGCGAFRDTSIITYQLIAPLIIHSPKCASRWFDAIARFEVPMWRLPVGL